jgi:hypothetical protein
MAPSGRGLREAVGEPAHVWVMVFFWLFKRTDKLQFKYFAIAYDLP